MGKHHLFLPGGNFVRLQPGDLAACHALDRTSRGIRLATFSPFGPRRLRLGPSHVAIVCEYQGEHLWVESTTLASRPCLIQGKRVDGAQAHRTADRIEDYVAGGGFVDIYRLTPINSLSNSERHLLSRILIEHFVRSALPYDLQGAALSGTRLFQRSRLFPSANLDRLFCSELVAAVLMRLNRLNHANPARYHPARLLRELIRTGKYQFVQRLGRP